MLLGTGCLADAALDGPAIVAALDVVRLDHVLLVARPDARPRGLAGVPAVAVRAAWEERERAVTAARHSRARRLILELPAEASLEDACRGLFDLSRAQPGLSLAILNAEQGLASDPTRMEMVLDDLAGMALGYWHRPSRARLQGLADVTWLDRLGGRLVGVSIDDVAGDESGLPPGVGELDLTLFAELAGRSVDVAVDIDPLPDVGLLRVAVENLHAAGFP